MTTSHMKTAESQRERFGRDGDKLGSSSYTGKLIVQRVRLDSYGYDGLGAYWGIGDPLFQLTSPDGSIDRCYRAKNRDKAIAMGEKWYPNAKLARRQ